MNRIRAAVGAAGLVATTTILAAACIPPDCSTAQGRTFGMVQCAVTDGYRADITYYSPLYDVYKHSVGPWVDSGTASFAYVPDWEILHGAYVVSVDADT